MISPKKRYWRRVKTILGLEQDRKPSASSTRLVVDETVEPQAANTDIESPRPLEGEVRLFERRLKEIATHDRGDATLVTGKVHLINVQKIRERVRERWPQMERRIHRTIRKELGHRLSRHDFFTQVDEASYAIVFGDCSKAEAQLKIALLSEQILEKLFGEAEAKEFEMLGVQTLVMRANGEAATDALKNADALLGLLDQAEVTALDPDAHRSRKGAGKHRGLSAADVAELLSGVALDLETDAVTETEETTVEIKVDRLRELLRQLEDLEKTVAERFTFSDDDHAARSSAAAGVATDSRRTTLELAKQIKARVEKKIAFVYSSDPTSGKANQNCEGAAIDLLYFPVWHVPSERLGIYHARLAATDPGGYIPSHLTDADDVAEDINSVVDRLGFRMTCGHLQKVIREGTPAAVIVPIHMSTLRRMGTRRRLLAVVSSIPQPLRGLIIWEIVGAHVDSWSLQLGPVVASLKPFGRAVFLRLENVQACFTEIRRNLRYLKAAGVDEIGLDVSEIEGEEKEIIRLLESLVVNAARSELRCYGQGFSSLSLIICAACIGYQHISGPLVAGPLREPDGIRTMTIKMLYRRLVFYNEEVGRGDAPRASIGAAAQ